MNFRTESKNKPKIVSARRWIFTVCPKCMGHKQLIDNYTPYVEVEVDCPKCHGKGYLKEDRIVYVRLSIVLSIAMLIMLMIAASMLGNTLGLMQTIILPLVVLAVGLGYEYFTESFREKLKAHRILSSLTEDDYQKALEEFLNENKKDRKGKELNLGIDWEEYDEKPSNYNPEAANLNARQSSRAKW